jgi:hypothetical protein
MNTDSNKLYKYMKNKLSIVLFIILLFAINLQAQTENKIENKASAAITYKVPDGVMPMKWHDFKGMLMLGGEKPSGIFITYPNEGESIADLEIRAGKEIARMFVHDESKAGKIDWQSKTIPAHEGDKGTEALIKTYDSPEETLQIAYYEREWSGFNFIYGYFARKSKTSKNKNDSAEFMDESGGGIKPFEKFWKTFPKASN